MWDLGKSPRRLVFMASKEWTGWICERCWWNVPRPARPQEISAVLATIDRDFEGHSCEAFARENCSAIQEQ